MLNTYTRGPTLRKSLRPEGLSYRGVRNGSRLPVRGDSFYGERGWKWGEQFGGGIRIMEWNKLRIALDPGESMFARHTLMQLATKLAIGLGALFLVGVLLAAIPNHRAPVVEGVSAAPGQEVQGTDRSAVTGVNTDETRSHEKDAAQDVSHRRATRPKAGDSSR